MQEGERERKKGGGRREREKRERGWRERRKVSEHVNKKLESTATKV